MNIINRCVWSIDLNSYLYKHIIVIKFEKRKIQKISEQREIVSARR